MFIKFYGTRGSIPVCEKGFQEFGGNTTCVGLFGEDHEDIVIFDAGTGIRNLGKELMKKQFLPNQRIIIGFSHFHWDHIQGFPFFAPAYDPSKNIELVAYGKDLTIPNLKDVFLKQMESTFFPISLDDMGAKFSFELRKINEQINDKGKLYVNAHSHPGGAHGYRLEINGKIIVFCTDVEHVDGIDPNVVELSRNANILIHEGQYTPEELPKYKGWGHSSWEQAIEVAELANVKKLFITHHDPDHDDEFLQKVELQCQKRFPNCYLAREGKEIHF